MGRGRLPVVSRLWTALRWATRYALFFILVAYTVWLFNKLSEDIGPFPHNISFWSVDLIDPRQYGIDRLPDGYGAAPDRQFSLPLDGHRGRFFKFSSWAV